MKIGRGYWFAFAYLAGAILLAAAAMFTNNPNWKAIIEWYGGLGITLVVPIVGAKELGKVGQSVFGRRTNPKPPEG
jgi:hypothetical protein